MEYVRRHVRYVTDQPVVLRHSTSHLMDLGSVESGVGEFRVSRSAMNTGTLFSGEFRDKCFHRCIQG